MVLRGLRGPLQVQALKSAASVFANPRQRTGDALESAFACMGTVVSLRVVGHAATQEQIAERAEAVARAVAWFHHVESVCSRFEPDSELSRLSLNAVGQRVHVSEMLLQALDFALALAHLTDGAFDPTVGARMEQRGFDRNHRTGARRRSEPAADGATFRDVDLDREARRVTFARPLLLDLGATAKGLAIDLAAHELTPLGRFLVNAGGDLYMGGANERCRPWTVGIRDPRGGDEPIETVSASNVAVCTSGNYERRGPDGETHIVDPRSHAPLEVSSATVMAPSAMAADGLATAAFVLGPERGLSLLENEGAEGLIFTSEMGRHATAGWPAA